MDLCGSSCGLRCGGVDDAPPCDDVWDGNVQVGDEDGHGVEGVGNGNEVEGDDEVHDDTQTLHEEEEEDKTPHVVLVGT